MKTRLLKSTLVVGLMTTLSRVFGLLRDVVIATLFGPGAGVDAFIVAFRIPNFMRRIFAEGGFSQAFVPVLSEYRAQRETAEVRALVDQTSAVLGLALLLISTLGVLAAPWLIYLFAPGFITDPDKQLLAADMLRITFPYILFISLTALAGGVLNTYDRFAVPAFTPVLLNLSLIACAIWLAPLFPEHQRVVALAWGVFIAGIVQLLFQLPFLARLGMFPRPGLNRDRQGVRRIITLMLPALFAVSVTQINLLVDTIIASFLQTGSISWLYFSDRLVEFPLGVFGIALATVILPHLSSKHSSDESGAFSRTLDWALRWALLIAVPAALGLALLAKPVLMTIFQYNAFSYYDTDMSSISLLAYTAGLPAFILIKVLQSGYFSRQDTRTPVKIGVIAMLSNIVLNLILVFPLAHAGLALATSLSACINAALLYRILHRDGHYRHERGWVKHLGRILVAAGAMCVLLYLYVPHADAWDVMPVALRVQNLVLWVTAGCLIYLVTLWLTGLRRLSLAPGGDPS